MSRADEILRRHFIAIATDTFAASGTYPPLDVASEVASLSGWLTDETLEDRRFSNQEYEPLAHNPNYDQIRATLTGGEFTSADAVVLYVTGHGQSAQGVHWVILQDSDPGRLSHKSLSTAELIRWLAAYRDLNDVLVIVDLCQAGDATDELPATLHRDLPEGWFALFTAPAGVDARLGAFSGVLESLITDVRAARITPGSDDAERYLSAPIFFAELKKRLHEKYRQKLEVINLPYGPSVCLPNPRYDVSRLAPVKTSPARRDLALLQSTLDAHWLHRAPVTFEQGSVFTGRRLLMSRLISFVDAGAPGTLVVTGRAGCGKSAILARLVTCSDKSFRAQYADVLAAADPVPGVDSVDVAVLATGKTAEQIARQIARACDAPSPTDAGLEELINAISTTAAGRDRPATVVIDALDEASDPTAVALTLLERLNPPEYPRLRLIVGIRSSGTATADDHGGRELPGMISKALRAQSLHADADKFWEEQDLADYAEQLLTRGRPSSPVQVDLAHRIAAGSNRSFLLAGLVARHLTEFSTRTVDDARLREVLESGVKELLSQDVESSIASQPMRDKTMRLLRASALSFGRGIPWRGLWATAATALDPARPIDQDDVQRLLDHRLSGYLIRDTEDGAVVYRLFHDELRAALADGLPGEPDPAAAHRAITRALLDASAREALTLVTSIPLPYVRRHLASHAAEAGVLEETLDAEIIPYLDPERLGELMRLTQPPAYSGLWLLLGAWRSVRHRLSWEEPRDSAAAFDAALLASGMEPPRRHDIGLSWTPRWTNWMTGGTVVGSLEGRQPHAVFGSLAGRAVLAAGGDGEVWVWEAATGRPIGQSLPAPGEVAAVAVGGDDGAMLASIGRSGRLVTWDAATRVQSYSLVLPDDAIRSLATGRLDGGWVVVAAGASGQVFVRWLDSGEEALPPFWTAPFVRSLAVAETSVGPRVAAGHSDGTVGVWDLERREQLGAPIEAGSEVNAVDLVEYDGHDALLAVGTSRGTASVWHLASGTQVGPHWQHHSEVRAIALGLVGDQVMLCAGCLDGTVHLGPALQPALGTALPHPGAVTTAEFGDVDGRTMVATACMDGNVRLWDPVGPSAPRIGVEGHIGSVTIVAREGETVDVLTGNDKAQLQWWSGDDGHQVLQVDIAGKRPAPMEKWAGPPTAEVAAGYVDGRLIALTSYLGTIQVLELHETQHDKPRLIREHLSNDGLWRPTALHVDNDQALFATITEWSEPPRIYDALTGRPLIKRPPWQSDSSVLGFHSLGGRTWLAVTDSGQRLSLFDIEDGTRLGAPVELEIMQPEITLGMLEGEPVLAVLGSGQVRICDAESGRDRIPPIQTSPTAHAVAFAMLGPGEVLLTAHFATVRVWNPFTGRRLAQLPFGTNIDAMAVHSSPDGTVQVAVGGPGLLLTELHE